VTTATVIVESRHLDTDARARDEYQVAMPTDQVQEKSRLVELVTGLHPHAKHRSYAEGAATFLDSDHLIVAFYESRNLLSSPSRGGFAGRGRPAQDRLFDS
jgi:hypothetical protein